MLGTSRWVDRFLDRSFSWSIVHLTDRSLDRFLLSFNDRSVERSFSWSIVRLIASFYTWSIIQLIDRSVDRSFPTDRSFSSDRLHSTTTQQRDAQTTEQFFKWDFVCHCYVCCSQRRCIDAQTMHRCTNNDAQITKQFFEWDFVWRCFVCCSLRRNAILCRCTVWRWPVILTVCQSVRVEGRTKCLRFIDFCLTTSQNVSVEMYVTSAPQLRAPLPEKLDGALATKSIPFFHGR